MDVDLEELAAIVELLEKADFTDFRYDKGDLHIAVRRGGVLPPTEGLAAPSAPDAAATAPTAQSMARPQPSVAAAAELVATQPLERASAQQEGDVVVTAPMLGVFYRAAKPGEPPFVQVGDKVAEDSSVCIVEVMKLMNSVPAGAAGEVVEVRATDGDLVEFGQPLFVIRPAA